MISLEESACILHLCFALALLWVLIFVCWKNYRVDQLRQNLFALRDDLFDFALTGAVAFDHPAYGKLRTTINGMIRFAHRIAFPRILLAVLTERIWHDPSKRTPFEEWQEAVDTIRSTEVQERLRELHQRMYVLVVGHMISRSPTLLVFLAVFVSWAIVNGMAKRLIDAFTQRVPGLELLEAEALEAQELEAEAVPA